MTVQMIAAGWHAETKLEPRKRREVEAAWRQHDFTQGRVPAWAKRQLILLKQIYSAEADAVEHLLHGPAGHPRWALRECLRARGVARLAALKRLRAVIPDVAIAADKNSVELRWLCPHGPVLAVPKREGEKQDCVVLLAALVTRTGLTRTWLIECPDHAAGRYLERAPGSDLRAALLIAADAFIKSDIGEVLLTLGERRDLHLPTGDGGLLVCDVIRGRIEQTDRSVTYARCRTFISRDMVEETQVPLAPAVRAAQSIAALATVGC